MLEHCIKELHMLGIVEFRFYNIQLRWIGNKWKSRNGLTTIGCFLRQALKTSGTNKSYLKSLLPEIQHIFGNFDECISPSLGSLTYIRHNPGMFN